MAFWFSAHSKIYEQELNWVLLKENPLQTEGADKAQTGIRYL